MHETRYGLSNICQTILPGCLAGDRVSQERLYHHFSNRMMAVSMWYARNREEAEEILQDGFVRVFRYIKAYKNSGSLEGWIRSVMVSAALSHYRNKTSKLWAVHELNEYAYSLPIEPVFASRYDENELLKLVQQLPPAYRMVFNLYVFEGLKHREIAAALQISEGTSKSNLFDARRILQKALKTKEIAVI